MGPKELAFKRSISHLISICDYQLDQAEYPGVKIVRVAGKPDCLSTDLFEDFAPASRMMLEVQVFNKELELRGGGVKFEFPEDDPNNLEFNQFKKVLYIHCEQGMSRSATVLMAYLLLVCGPSSLFTDIFNAVRAKRFVVLPNDAFIEQLKRYSHGPKSLRNQLHCQLIQNVSQQEMPGTNLLDAGQMLGMLKLDIAVDFASLFRNYESEVEADVQELHRDFKSELAPDVASLAAKWELLFEQARAEAMGGTTPMQRRRLTQAKAKSESAHKSMLKAKKVRKIN